MDLHADIFKKEPPTLQLEDLQSIGAGAFFRPVDAEELGVSYYRLRQLVEQGAVERVGRGLYRLADADLTQHYTLAAVCARVPDAIVCLLSALQYYEIGTRLPREVWIAIPHKARAPRLPNLPARIIRFSGASAQYGIEEVEIDGAPIRITSIARTVVDCFRFHRIISQEAALEAAREALYEKRASTAEIWRAAEVCGAMTLIRPALEAMA